MTMIQNFVDGFSGVDEYSLLMSENSHQKDFLINHSIVDYNVEYGNNVTDTSLLSLYQDQDASPSSSNSSPTLPNTPDVDYTNSQYLSISGSSNLADMPSSYNEYSGYHSSPDQEISSISPTNELSFYSSEIPLSQNTLPVTGYTNIATYNDIYQQNAISLIDNNNISKQLAPPIDFNSTPKQMYSLDPMSMSALNAGVCSIPTGSMIPIGLGIMPHMARQIPRPKPKISRKQSESRLSLPLLYNRMGLSNNHELARVREHRVLSLLRSQGFKLGEQTWIRDTKEHERKRIIDYIWNETKEEFNYDKELIEVIVRRGSYYLMQGRLRRIRRGKRAAALKKNQNQQKV